MRNKVADATPLTPMNKALLITGASSGIGRAATLLFAHEGWNGIAPCDPAAGRQPTRLGQVTVGRRDVPGQASNGAANADFVGFMPSCFRSMS